MTRYLPLILAAGLAVLVLVAGCTTQPAGSATASPGVHATTEKSMAPVHTPAPAEKTTVPIAAQTSVKTLPPTQTTLPRISVPEGYIAQYYTYRLNGKSDIIPLALSTKVYQDYTKKDSPSIHNGNSSYFLGYINDPEQQPYIAALAKAIQEKTPVKDDQARIAISLVQHIPYHDGTQYRYPYEVLYNGKGVCGEKSMLLALLLKELGFGSSVFYLLPEDHMTAGIKVSSPYDFRNSGYAFIEATEPYIITDSVTDTLAAYRFTSTMEVTPVGTGQALQSIANDYNDAREWAALEAKGKTLATADYAAWQALNTKYDLRYYTCEKCPIPSIA